MRDIRTKFGITNLPQSSDVGQDYDGGISSFQLSAQSFIGENCYNSTTSHGPDMKHGPVIKFGKQNMAT